MKEVFISRPNWVPSEFEDGLKFFYNLLKASNLNPRTIGQSDFPSKSPLDEVINLLKKCEGTIVLGIPQIFISEGFIKEEKITNNIQLGTEWNQIEAALAHSLRQPLLIIHDKSVKRGIFDRGASNSFLHSIDMTEKTWAMSDEISGVISNFKTELKGLKKDMQENNKLSPIKENLPYKIIYGCLKFEDREGLFCPICYEKDNLFMLTSRRGTRYRLCNACGGQF